jgi:hypothetical protein
VTDRTRIRTRDHGHKYDPDLFCMFCGKSIDLSKPETKCPSSVPDIHTQKGGSVPAVDGAR